MGERFTVKEMLARLVAFPTVSRDSNLELIHFVRDYLAGWGVESALVPHPSEPKAGLHAAIGPDAPGGVVLSGHSDVVPVDGQEWASDPWTLTERGGRLYGRGAADMKGFLALALALVPDMLAAGLKRPVQLAISYDEEVGCTGAPPLVAALRAARAPASAVIVGEPTRWGVVTSHKGMVGFTTRVRGVEVHSSRVHEGVSAVMTAARLIEWHRLRMAENADKADGGSLFDPPYTTLHVGRVEGGTAHNITAGRCWFSTDIRVLPEEDSGYWRAAYERYAREVEAEIRAAREEAAVALELRVELTGCRREPPTEAAAEALARALTGDNAERAVSYGTEAGHFQAGGYSTVVMGPGDIAQAHQADEFVETAELERGEAVLRGLVGRLAG